MPGKALQGNLDPGLLLGMPDEVARRTRAIVAATEGKAHIVNLGHGVLPSARIECVEAFFAAAREPLGVAARGVAAVEAGHEARRRPPRSPPPLQRPGAPLHVLPDGARLEGGLRAGRLRVGALRERAGAQPRPALALPAPALLRKALLLLRLHGRHHGRSTASRTRTSRPSSARSTGSPTAPGRGREVVQLHLGGGTPTYFAPERLERIASRLRERFRFEPDAEIGVEVDPRVTTPRAPGVAREGRVQPALDGRPGLRPARPGGDQPDPALRGDARARREGARAPGLPERQHGSDLRPSAPDGRRPSPRRSTGCSRSRRTGSPSTRTRTSRG